MLKRILSTLLSALLGAGMLLPASAATTPVLSGETNDYTSTCEWLDEVFVYDGQLGADYSSTSTTFRVWAPVATNITLKRYSTGSDDEDGAMSLGDYQMTKNDSTGVWSVTVDGDLVNTYYTYEITTPDVMNKNPATHETQDIYSYAVGVNGNRSMVVDFKNTNPDGWENDKHVLLKNPTDSFVWEIHIKDFSYDPSSGVTEKNRGKYLAFTETGTTVNGKGGMSTCIDYLKNLGVTTVQINPFNDFGSIDERDSESKFNWGYDPKNYSVPEGSYSTNPYDGNVRIKECKQMIQALHNAGISVVMDVVYNHTFSTDSCFNYTVPKYYYRMWHERNDDWSEYYDRYVYSNGSGCGNETASERRMYRKYMVDSIVHWAKEYHIDGFRFDLMALHDVETLNAVRKALDENVDKRITMWGEGWTGGGGEYPGLTWDKKTFVRAEIGYHPGLDERIGFFNDGLRDALRGNNDLNVDGWLQKGNDSNNWNVAAGMKAEKGDSFSVPTQVVSYAACHDNRTLWDQLCASQGLTDYYYTRNEKLVSQSKLSGAVLNMSQGATFVLAGEEMGRSKGGEHNSYNKPPEINKIDWNLAQTNSDMVSYYRGLRKIRENFALFTSPNRTSNNYYFLPITSKDQIACICTNTNNDQWNKLIYIANSSDYAIKYQVPTNQEQNWVILSDGNKAGLKSLGEVTNGSFSVPANSMVIAVDATSYKSVNVSDNTCTIDVRFVNEATGEELYRYSMSGDRGTSYSIYKPDVYDNDYIFDSVSDDPKGTYSVDKEITVNYICVNAGTVNINYLKTGTNEKIRDNDVIKALIGDTITLGDPPPMLGYKLNNSQALPESEVPIVYGNTDINYYYDEITRNVKLHIRHSGSETWAPIVWIWGEGSNNYCTSTKFPGDTLNDADGDGWYDTSFNVKSTEKSFNLIISSEYSQTVDYNGLADGELWIIIDDNNNGYGSDNLTFYTENPLTTENAHIAGRSGSINYTNKNIEPKLYQITKEECMETTVSGYLADKTIPGAEVVVKVDRSKIPNGLAYIGIKINEGSVQLKEISTDTFTFTMPENDVSIKVVLENEQIILTHIEAVPATCEQEGRIDYYTDENGRLYLDKDGTPMSDNNGDGTVDLKDTIIQEKGHNWEEPVWKWRGETATASFTCKNDATHNTDLDAQVEIDKVTNTLGIVEKIVCNAAVTLDGKTYTNEKEYYIDYTDSESDTDSDTQSDTETNSDTDTVTETDTDTDSESDTETNSDTYTATETDSNSEVDSETNSDTDTNTEADSETNQDTETITETDVGTESDSETNQDTESSTESDSETNQDTESSTESDSETNQDTDTSTETDSEIETNSDTNTETDSNTESDTESDTNTDSSDENTRELGDVDDDGKISAKDSMLIQRYVINLKKLDELQQKYADVNGDGKVTNKDALEILRYTIHMSKSDRIGKIIA